MKRKIVPILGCSLILGLLFDWFFYEKLPGITIFLYTSLILGLMFYLAGLFRSVVNRSVYWLAPVALFFSLMVSVRANPFLAFLNITLVTYLLVLIVCLSRQPKITLQKYTILQYFTSSALVPMNIAGRFLRLLAGAANNRSPKVPSTSLTPIIRGFIISLPILVLFIVLLSSADLVFSKFITSLFSPSVSFETIFHWGLIGFVTCFFIGTFALIFMSPSIPESSQGKHDSPFGLGATEASIVLGSVVSLFFVFVMIQLAYLFGGSGQIVATGHTYAEYARKGFFELIAVASISLFLILIIKNITTFHTSFQKVTFKWLSTLMVAEVMVIMLSAHRRLNLYEEAYGFTILRLLSHLFILWLAVAFVLLFIHIVKVRNNMNFAFQLFISGLCFFAVVNAINPDNFIARQNIERYKKIGKLDVYYLSNLSEDATHTIAGLLDDSDEKLRNSAGYILSRQKRAVPSQFTGWQSTNAARLRADKVFRDNAVQIEAAKSYNSDLNLDPL